MSYVIRFQFTYAAPYESQNWVSISQRSLAFWSFGKAKKANGDSGHSGRRKRRAAKKVAAEGMGRSKR